MLDVKDGTAETAQATTLAADETSEQPASNLAVVLDPTCCPVTRQRVLQGITVIHMATHQPDCPTWSAR
ncbi:hypothetical protein [Streptacidiphilus sp. EB103A]|uniref:hypothetical protein n=1 Tax=Streptacidiphilus sp. EB103A TaxID=3156275 RepID=UPI003515A146